MLDQIKELLEKSDYSYNITIHSVIKDLDLSRSTLHRKIKQMTGLSASNYINSLRLEKALSVLIRRPNSVREVSENVGFSDPKYFSKLFFKKYNRLPSSFLKVKKL